MRKPLLEHCQNLHIRDVKGAIPLRAVSAVLDIGTQEIGVVGKLTNLSNGYRYYFLCPQCHVRFESLYATDLGTWRCRVCVGAVYASTRKIRVESGYYENEYRSDH